MQVAHDGKRALEVARTFLPQIVLLDLEMPEMDGYEVAMRLRQHDECSKSLLVAVTGWGQEDDRRRSREMGLCMHMVKPVSAKDLRGMFETLKPKLLDLSDCRLH